MDHLLLFYRRRVDFGLEDYSNSDLADEDLTAMIREFWQDNPDVGESMAVGLLRARGYRVVRARIHDALRNSDPLSTALRWPGRKTRRRVYSVAGPNSLWHIGKYFIINFVGRAYKFMDVQSCSMTTR